MQAPQHHPEASPTYPCTLEKLYRYTMLDLPVRVGSDCATAEISNGSVDLPRVRGGVARWLGRTYPCVRAGARRTGFKGPTKYVWTYPCA